VGATGKLSIDANARRLPIGSSGCDSQSPTGLLSTQVLVPRFSRHLCYRRQADYGWRSEPRTGNLSDGGAGAIQVPSFRFAK